VASSPRIDPSIAAQIDRLATAVAKDPRSKEFLPLAEEYIKVGMWQEAAAVLEDGLQAYPGFVTAMVALGRVYDQLAQTEKAKAILGGVVKQRPDNLRAHRILAKLYNSEGNAELALRSCHAILNANPCDEEALSIKRSITGAPDELPQSKRDKKRLIAEIKAETVNASALPAPAPEPGAYAAALPSEPITEAAPEAITEPPVVMHAATIARLEAWLRTIHAQRNH
jgi:tetratricopeptide (TPR) repeat protein